MHISFAFAEDRPPTQAGFESHFQRDESNPKRVVIQSEGGGSPIYVDLFPFGESAELICEMLVKAPRTFSAANSWAPKHSVFGQLQDRLLTLFPEFLIGAADWHSYAHLELGEGQSLRLHSSNDKPDQWTTDVRIQRQGWAKFSTHWAFGLTGPLSANMDGFFRALVQLENGEIAQPSADDKFPRLLDIRGKLHGKEFDVQSIAVRLNYNSVRNNSVSTQDFVQIVGELQLNSSEKYIVRSDSGQTFQVNLLKSDLPAIFAPANQEVGLQDLVGKRVLVQGVSSRSSIIDVYAWTPELTFVRADLGNINVRDKDGFSRLARLLNDSTNRVGAGMIASLLAQPGISVDEKAADAALVMAPLETAVLVLQHPSLRRGAVRDAAAKAIALRLPSIFMRRITEDASPDYYSIGRILATLGMTPGLQEAVIQSLLLLHELDQKVSQPKPNHYYNLQQRFLIGLAEMEDLGYSIPGAFQRLIPLGYRAREKINSQDSEWRMYLEILRSAPVGPGLK